MITRHMLIQQMFDVSMLRMVRLLPHPNFSKRMMPMRSGGPMMIPKLAKTSEVVRAEKPSDEADDAP